MVVFHYKKRSGKFDFDASKPLLTYSRPQGCSQDAARLLDFQLTNLNTLSSKGYRVEYEIDGVHRGALLDWRPYRIEGLAEGTHTIQLTLLRPDGERAPGRFNQTTRTIGTGSVCPEAGIVPDETAEEDEESLLEEPAPKITNPGPKPKR